MGGRRGASPIMPMKFASWFRRESPVASFGPLDATHAEAVADLHAAAFARPWSAIDFEGMLAERDILADGLFLGAQAAPVGFALSRRVLNEAEILTIAIAPDGRGLGLSRPLLAHHLGELRLRGVRRVHLEVEEGHEPALRLYRGLGFEEVGRRSAYYAKPDGATASALTMSLTL
jgi:[ribosomal protein S18]-alanine N-acetyltransferase